MSTTHGQRYAGHSDDPGALTTIESLARVIAERVRPGPIERIALADAAGHVLARSVLAERDYPAFDKSMMDGFAIRAADSASAPVELAVIGEVSAGRIASVPIGFGQAMRINTGAPIPSGADAVVMREQTQITDDGARVRILAPIRTGQNMVHAGSDCRARQIILESGTRLGVAQIAAAATAGAAQIDVYQEPQVALLVTGDELVRVGERPAAGQIIDSNGPSLTVLARTSGARVTNLGICPDNRDRLRAALLQALQSPIVVVVGGMSMGTLDLAPEALASLGVTWLVHGVSLRPGRPMGYGVGPTGQHVFGLPGNPVSCFVCFSLFVKIAIDGLSGLAAELPTLWKVRLRTDTSGSRDKRPAFIPARLSISDDGMPEALAVEWHGSGDPIGLGRANALLFQPEGGSGLKAGTMVSVLSLGNFGSCNEVRR